MPALSRQPLAERSVIQVTVLAAINTHSLPLSDQARGLFVVKVKHAAGFGDEDLQKPGAPVRARRVSG